MKLGLPIQHEIADLGERARDFADPENVAHPQVAFGGLRRREFRWHGPARRVRGGGETGKRQQ